MASLLQLVPVGKTSRYINAGAVVVNLALLVFFVMYLIRYERKEKLSFYHDLLVYALLLSAFVSGPAVTIVILVAWAVLKSCNKDIGALLVAIVVLLSLTVMFQIGVVVSGKLVVGITNGMTPTLDMTMGVVRSRSGTRTGVSVRRA